VLAQYHNRLTAGLPQVLGNKSLEDLLEDYPLMRETAAPFDIRAS